MEYYYLGLYADFSCLAGECPSTCCQGWRIEVDEQALGRFRALPDKKLRADILGNLVCRDGKYYFINMPDGSCAMLDGDGLCRIQRNTQEQMLCMTCRKYPRLVRLDGGVCRMSMSASCPVVADYLWRRPVSWYAVCEGKSRTIGIQDMEELGRELEELWDVCRCNAEGAGGVPGDICSCNAEKASWERYQTMLRLADGCLDLLAVSPELKYLEGGFDYFGREDRGEQEAAQDMQLFEGEWREALNRFYGNYFPYRIYSGTEGLSGETGGRNLFLLGEAALFYTVRFSRHFMLPESTRERVVEEINWLYRFCSHDRKRRQGFFAFLRAEFGSGRRLAELVF